MDRPKERASDLFNFITSEDFRTSLGDDYSELCSCMTTHSWKAVHVLAGSIVEAVLIDHLTATGYSTKDPLKMDLGEAIDACKGNVLSPRAADLCTVIRSYRNLIHPGRVIRLKETVDENSAQVAKALVDMVIQDVAKRKQETYGYTAEQVVDKVETDPSCLPFLGHLVKDMQPIEKERLLLEVLPKDYLLMLQGADYFPDKVRQSLQECFRMVFKEVPDDVKQKVTRRYITLLKEGSEGTIHGYERAFFEAGDLRYAVPQDVELVKKHLFALLSGKLDEGLINMLRGIGPLLAPDDFQLFLGPLCFHATDPDSNLQWCAQDRIFRECGPDSEMKQGIRTDMLQWVSAQFARPYGADRFRKLAEVINSGPDIPF